MSETNGIHHLIMSSRPAFIGLNFLGIDIRKLIRRINRWGSNVLVYGPNFDYSEFERLNTLGLKQEVGRYSIDPSFCITPNHLSQGRWSMFDRPISYVPYNSEVIIQLQGYELWSNIINNRDFKNPWTATILALDRLATEYNRKRISPDEASNIKRGFMDKASELCKNISLNPFETNLPPMALIYDSFAGITHSENRSRIAGIMLELLDRKAGQCLLSTPLDETLLPDKVESLFPNTNIRHHTFERGQVIHYAIQHKNSRKRK